MIRIIPKNTQHSLLFKSKIAILAIFFLAVLISYSSANDINVAYEWYHYQGASDSNLPSRDCGPTCVSMAIRFVKQEVVPISEIRDYLGHKEGTSISDVSECLNHWGISHDWQTSEISNIVNIINNHNHILLCGLSLNLLSKGRDIDGQSDNPSFFHDRYSSYGGDHWVVIKGITDDAQWVIVYDPNVFGSYPYPKFWYLNGKPKGKDRYYNIHELDKAMVNLIEIKGGPGDVISRKFSQNANIRITDENGLILRKAPGFGSIIIKTLPKDTLGHIVYDTKNGRYADGFHWWRVRFGDFEGWCIEDYLDMIQLSTTTSLTISGTVKYSSDDSPAPNGLEIVVVDEARKFYITTTTGNVGNGKYFVTISNDNNIPIATGGYYIRVIVKDDGYILGTRTYTLTLEDIAKASAVIDVKIGDSVIPENVDVNRDGLLNNFDLIQLGMNFDKRGYNISGDLNGDGKVDFIDLIHIAGFLYSDIPVLSMDNHVLIERIYNVLATVLDPSPNLIFLIKRLDPFLNYNVTGLFQNYPNPCNPGTWIPFKLKEQADVSIVICDVLGKKVRALELGSLPEGRYTTKDRAVYWDGCNEAGEEVSSGVYFYTLIAGRYRQTERLLVLR